MISIIVPVYNRKNTLERCVASILNQSYTDFELLLIDDGSTDGSAKLCDQLTRRDSRIKVLHQKTSGPSAARNRGLKSAKGEYVTFVDSDDTIAPTMLEVLLNEIQHHQVKLSICTFAEVFPGGQRKIFARASDKSQVLDTKTCLQKLLLEQGFMLSVWGKLYARELFTHVQFPEGKLHEDVGVTYRLILQCDRIAFTNFVGYNYYQHSDSIIHYDFDARKLDLIALTDAMCDEIDAKFLELKNVTNQRRMHARFSILRQLHGRPKVKQGITQYLKTHRNYILQNPFATPRDRFALRLVLLNLPLAPFYRFMNFMRRQ